MKALAAAALTALTALAAGAGSEDLDAALRQCAGEIDATQRLACFDAIVVRLPQVQADRVGLTEKIKQRRDPELAKAAKGPLLTAKISSVSGAAYGKRVFTLDNGQRWIEADLRPNTEFAAGDQVSVQTGAMESLWLVASRHRELRVTRLQ
jgi:hypothetical protein